MPNPNQPAPVTETILAQRHKHWINVAPVMFSTLILALVFVAASSYYAGHTDTVNQYIPVAGISALTFIYWVLIIGIALLAIWIYRQNRIVLTNHHIMQYTRRGLFDHSVSQFSLIKLQDVSCRQKGILANLLSYGDIEIETAGEEENFSFKQVPSPQTLADQIMQAHEALESAQTKPDEV
ncbi:MAG TPA: PH domain-containing protein [Candidatus Saccharimonadales bacterium]|nr:PH domain-containing protein [Candidatus Saccharimonadales bacterium]